MCDLARKGTKLIKKGAHQGKGIAVFTSGGDAQVLYFFLIASIELR